MATYGFSYDAQIERFLIQFIRVMSGFQVEFGKDAAGNKTLQRVPVYYGDGSRQVAAIISNNSETALPTVPAMTVYISGVRFDRERVQEPNFVGKMNVRQRAYNEITQEYDTKEGNAFTIERMMPVPYELELKLDIWTSNNRQKLQLFEQIAPMFNIALELQSTDNYIDWTSLTAIFLDSTNWTSRSVPIGTDNNIDVLTMTFKLPIWISPPAKVKKLGVIQKIVAGIHDANGNLNDAIYNETNLLGARQYFTPMDYAVLLVGNTLTLLKPSEIASPHSPTIEQQTKLGTKDSWKNLINVYGSLQNGLSQIRLTDDNEVNEIIGAVSFHPTDDSLLIFNADIDTYPANTLQSIDAIIDPHKSLTQTVVTGTRFLILNAIGSFNTPQGYGPSMWRGTNGQDLVANANDIIQYNGTNWVVAFDSNSEINTQYVSNLNTSVQYRWDTTQKQWVKSWEGFYSGGNWTLVL